MVYCMRLVMLKHALPPGVLQGLEEPEGPEAPNPLQRVIDVHKQWLVDSEQSPFSDISNLLAYGRSIGPAGGRPAVTWSVDGKELRFRGQLIEVERFREFIHSILAEAEELLSEIICDEDGTAIKSIDLHAIRDDMTEDEVGLSFVDNPENRLDGGETRVLDRMEKLAGFPGKFNVAEDGARFKPGVIKEMHDKIERFLKLLLVLVYLTAGQPPRGTELVTARHRNSVYGSRTVYVHDGQVMIVTEYDKSMAQYGNHRVVCRFLPARVGRLLVAYLTEARPLQELLQMMDPTAWVSDTMLWETEPGRLWDTAKISQILKAETGKHLGVRLDISSLRHIMIAFGRRFKDALKDFAPANDNNDDDGDDDDDDDDDDDGNGGDHVFDLQGSHGTRIAKLVYAVRTGCLESLNQEMMDKFFLISERWHRFLGLESRAVAANSRKRGSSPSTTTATATTTTTGPLPKRARRSRSQPSASEPPRSEPL